MKVVTKRDKCLRVPGRWREQYPEDLWGTDERKMEIASKLDSLKISEATPEVIDAIIGNDSWTRLQCGICEDDVSKAVIMSDAWGTSAITVCRKCLTRAVSAIDNA